MGRCKRRGLCCQDVRLDVSPEMLHNAYEFWRKSKSIDPGFSEIYLIYPMLEFKFEHGSEDLPYHYRCRHFTHGADGLPACAIYEIRPRMCRDFPYYESVEHLDRTGPLSPYDGCGYNDPD
ncbi:MAG TPA: YkgJ family cysteine cluster protein [Spirochaetota bacterium]|nr:YkgJ family cysteine cluster protein [Spirochaetota bacterium]HPU87873.1 YkgJ family cysteine cluster protein [Spirochaetota bacterium]